MGFYTKEQLEKIAFKSIGNNVIIDDYYVLSADGEIH